MNIDINNIVKLNDGKFYIVVSKINYNNKIYYYLSEANNSDNYIYCYENNDELVEVIDQSLLVNLSLLFIENTIEYVNKNEEDEVS